MIETIKTEGPWLRVYDRHGNKLSQMLCIQLTVVAVCNHFFVTQQGPWIMTYNEHCHCMGQLLTSNIEVRSATAHTFTTIEGHWMRMYDVRCNQIKEREIGERVARAIIY